VNRIAIIGCGGSGKSRPASAPAQEHPCEVSSNQQGRDDKSRKRVVISAGEVHCG
jgi:hypothetical protein